MIKAKGSFKCGFCKVVFLKGRSDGETLVEYEETYGIRFNPNQALIICDDCYNLVRRRPPR